MEEKLQGLKDQLAELDGSVITPLSEEEEAQQTSDTIDKLTAKAEAEERKKEASKLEHKIAILEKGLKDADTETGLKEELEAEIEALEKRLGDLQPLLDEDENRAVLASNEDKEKEE